MYFIKRELITKDDEENCNQNGENENSKVHSQNNANLEPETRKSFVANSGNEESNLFGNVPIKLGPQKYGCPFCSKFMQTPSKMKLHIMTHTGEKPFVCNICEKCYSRKDALQYHLDRIHPKN